MIFESRRIKYAEGYKYQLRQTAYFQTPIYPNKDICTELVSLRQDGLLIVRPYFAWDGASGPTWDDKTNIRASLAHDALYYLMREGLLSRQWRKKADKLLKKLMLEDGAFRFRAAYYLWAVNFFAGKHATKKAARPVLVVPE